MEETKVKERIDDFLEHLSAEKGYSPHTLYAYDTDLTQFLDYLMAQAQGRRWVWAGVEKRDIISYIMHLKGERQYASATVARKVAAIKSFFHFLWRDGHINDDPTAALDSPRVEKRLPKVISLEEVKTLLAQPRKEGSAKGLRDRALLHLLYATGMRASEVVALNLDDLNLASASARCWGKGSKERIIPIHPQAVEALREYIERGRREFLKPENPGERALFLNQRGKRLTRQGLWLIVKGYVKERAARGDNPSYLAPLLRHPYVGGRRGPDKRPATPGTRQRLHHSDLHSCIQRATTGGVRQVAPPSQRLRRIKDGLSREPDGTV